METIRLVVRILPMLIILPIMGAFLSYAIAKSPSAQNKMKNFIVSMIGIGISIFVVVIAVLLPNQLSFAVTGTVSETENLYYRVIDRESGETEEGQLENGLTISVKFTNYTVEIGNNEMGYHEFFMYKDGQEELSYETTINNATISMEIGSHPLTLPLVVAGTVALILSIVSSLVKREKERELEYIYSNPDILARILSGRK